MRRPTQSLMVGVVSFVAAAAAAAARAQTPAPAPQRVVLRAARMLDVEAGRIVPNARVVIEGDKIQMVNPATLPEGVRIIDLGNVTLMPGLIDAHTHLTGEIGPNMLLEPVQETEIDAAFKAVKNARTTIMAGFTTVRDYGGQVTVSLGHAVDNGTILGPGIVPSRDGLGIPGGHCAVT